MSEKILDTLERENIKLASFSNRAYAFLIDELILSFLFMAIYWDYFKNAKSYEDAVLMVSSLAIQVIILRVIYNTFFTWYYGATVGKILLKITCIDISYLDKPNFITSLIRSLTRCISESCFYLGFAWCLSNPQRQTWHDKISKTVVIDVS